MSFSGIFSLLALDFFKEEIVFVIKIYNEEK